MALTSQPAWPARETVLLTGWIQTTRDAMLIVEGARTGRVPRVTRRFHDIERQNMLKSGAILVFTEEESGIKRWTDVFDWSPSRMLGNFLIYRERAEEQPALSDELPEIKPDPCTALLSIADSYLERCIFGSWRHGKNLKEDGMMKKTLSLEIEDIVYHIISYYRPSDVLSGLLHTPSSMEHMSDIKITYETTEATSKLRQPPQIKWDNEGRIISVTDRDEEALQCLLASQQQMTKVEEQDDLEMFDVLSAPMHTQAAFDQNPMHPSHEPDIYHLTPETLSSWHGDESSRYGVAHPLANTTDVHAYPAAVQWMHPPCSSVVHADTPFYHAGNTAHVELQAPLGAASARRLGYRPPAQQAPAQATGSHVHEASAQPAGRDACLPDHPHHAQHQRHFVGVPQPPMPQWWDAAAQQEAARCQAMLSASAGPSRYPHAVTSGWM